MLPPLIFSPPPPPAAFQGTIPVAVYWATCGGARSLRLLNHQPLEAEKVEGCRAADGAAGGSDGVTRTWSIQVMSLSNNGRHDQRGHTGGGSWVRGGGMESRRRSWWRRTNKRKSRRRRKGRSLNGCTSIQWEEEIFPVGPCRDRWTMKLAPNSSAC